MFSNEEQIGLQRHFDEWQSDHSSGGQCMCDLCKFSETVMWSFYGIVLDASGHGAYAIQNIRNTQRFK